MPKNRGYTRESSIKKWRDYNLFVIACEGSVTEPLYFSHFDTISKRLKVDVIQPAEGNKNKSAPRYVLDNAIKYIEKEGLLKEDSLWFVMDVDKWERTQLEEIANYCREYPNWHIVLSKPCFEVWLHLHHHNSTTEIEGLACKEIKTQIGIYNGEHQIALKNYPKHIKKAIEHAEVIDSDAQHYYPSDYTTKVYELAKELVSYLPG